MCDGVGGHDTKSISYSLTLRVSCEHVEESRLQSPYIYVSGLAASSGLYYSQNSVDCRQSRARYAGWYGMGFAGCVRTLPAGIRRLDVIPTRH